MEVKKERDMIVAAKSCGNLAIPTAEISGLERSMYGPYMGCRRGACGIQI